MKLIVIDKTNKTRINYLFKLILYIFGYTTAFLIVQLFFGSIVVDVNHKILVSFLVACIVHFIDKTIKPVLVRLAIPITALTLGLFYFVINTLILKLVDLMLGDLLTFTSIWKLFFISITLSAVNLIIENVVIKPIIRRVKHE